MKKSEDAQIRRAVLFCLVLFGLIAAFVVLPNRFQSKAGNAGQDLSERTVSHVEGLENYDIRADKSQSETLSNFRRAAGKNALSAASARDRFAAGESALRQKIPTLKIEYNQDIRTPEVIGTETGGGRAFLTAPSNAKRSEILRAFAAENDDLIGLQAGQAEQLKVTADYTNPDGNLSFAHLEQFINGVPVFRGEIKAGFTKAGEMIRVVNNVAPDLDYAALSIDFGDPLDAVKAAASNLNYDLKAADSVRNKAESTDLKIVFGTGSEATTAEKMYFPVEAGAARTAWRVLIWQPVSAFYVIVDAETNVVLWRKNITEDQSQAATYSVYANPFSMLNVAESPAAITPGPISPSLGTQGTQIARTTVTLIGNEGDLSFNNSGWVSDNANGANGWTDGNAVQAGLDIDGTNGVDAPVAGASRAFDFAYNPAPGFNSTAPDDIASPAFRNGIVTQLFYINNRYHDEMYKLGFTEAARNFQNDNFGRGGAAADRVSAEAQDSSGTNNANFSTPADGGRGRMQMYRFTQTPNRDGDIDADIVVHEYTHGLSNRLVGNGVGLSTARARGMGEGWSDFYGLALLSQESDPINGIYSTGAYATFNSFGLGTTNSFYGIRRFPYAVMAFTGGANNRPFNPLTFADLNAGCNLSDGAFAPAFVGTCNEVHNAGEIWASALWEVRAKFVQRLGWSNGNRRALQLVTDGMKLTPNAPTFVQARNAIIAAAQATSAADAADVRDGFRIRGLGFSAIDDGTTAVEAFDYPNVVAGAGFTVSDAPGDNDGFPEPGESVVLTVPITNAIGETVTNVTAAIVGGGNAGYGDIADNQTVSRQISYTIPSSAVCGNMFSVTININGSKGARTETRSFRLGKATFGGASENFDGAAAPALPANWTQENSGANTGWVTSAALAGSAPNAAFAPAPGTPGEASLYATVAVTSTAAKVSFKNFYNTELGYDGMVLEIQVGGGAFQDITAAGGSFPFASGGYNTLMAAGGPLAGRQAWSGSSTSFVYTTVYLPPSLNGQTIVLRWRAATDDSVTPASNPGTRIDDVVLFGGTFLSNYACSLSVPAASTKARADFDGDGKTDFSVFRPDEGNWYVKQSRDGLKSGRWGAATDKAVGGDFDGDGKADFAVYRPAEGNWYILKSSDANWYSVRFGLAEDKPVAADYDGDGKSDVAVYRPSESSWYILQSRDGFAGIKFGIATDAPVPADFDGDGKADVAVFRDGAWFVSQSTGGVGYFTFGSRGDRAVQADYDGDGKADVAVWRPSDGVWYILGSRSGFYGFPFGSATDAPAPGDYDGDGKTDAAVYRAGAWFVMGTRSGFMSDTFGVAADVTVPGRYIP